MLHNLTNRQREYLDFIREFIKQNNCAPRVNEIAKEFHVTSPTVTKTLNVLQDKGYLYFHRDKETGFFIRLWGRKTNLGNLREVPIIGLLDENGEVVGKGDFEAQHRQCLENIKRILEAAGAEMNDVVWILWFIRDMREGSKLRTLPAYREYFGDNDPPGTCVQISNLGTPELLLEVQVIAVIDD